MRMDDQRIVAQWESQREEAEALLKGAFVQHAIDNRGLLTSARRSPEVAEQLCELFIQFISGNAAEAEIAASAARLAGQGMALATGAAMMRALQETTWLKETDPDLAAAAISHLSRFQLLFLEKLAEARELVQRQTQEHSQLALQRALHDQLEKQRQLRRAQERRNRNLNDVFLLNARLARIENEDELLEAAIAGFHEALNLADITLYEQQLAEGQWAVRVSTVSGSQRGNAVAPDVADLLDAAVTGPGEIVNRLQMLSGKETINATMGLRMGEKVLGALIINSGVIDVSHHDEFLILIRTITQNLAALWRNLALLEETRQHAHELEILHGRYVDSIWSTEAAGLRAGLSDGKLLLKRASEPEPETQEGQEVPLRVGDHTFGKIILPEDSELDEDSIEFVQAVIREMGNALNNAYLIQTTSSYSNQLSLAADVSRAAATILDRDVLIQEVVDLIRSRFNLYYVGLFLVDERSETAVLRAGTGDAGRIQVEQGHKLAIGGRSIVGTAIAEGKSVAEQDVTRAASFHFNPLLPETRAELAVPLRIRDHVTGALTVQSTERGAFSPETISVLQSLADQLAVAIVNASLFAQIQTNLAETNRLYEAARRISSAATEMDIYQALVDFAAQSGLPDVAHIIIPEVSGPEWITSPIVWGENVRSGGRALFDEWFAPSELTLHLNEPVHPNCERLLSGISDWSQFCATLLIPIHIEDRWLGTLAIHCVDAERIRTDALQPYRALSDQTAVALANRQLLRQTAALYSIGRALSQTLTREDALEIAVREVAQYTGAAQCRFVQYDYAAGYGAVAAEYLRSEAADEMRFSIEQDSVFQYLDRELRPLLLQEGSEEVPAEVAHHYLEQLDAETSLLVPAASQQELLGFMALDSNMGDRLFSPSNVMFTQTVIDHLTTQLENLKLLDEALSRAQELITLNQIQSRISGILDLSSLAQTTYQQVGRLLDNTVFIFARYTAEISIYDPILIMDDGASRPTEPRAILPGDALYQVLRSGRAILVNPDSPLLRAGVIPDLSGTPLSSIWVPLQQEGQPIGLISVQSYRPNAYSENDIQLLRSIATQTSLAIANIQLFEEIQASNKQLRQLDHLKTQFLANMSHELRTPLNAIIGFSRVILKGIDGPITREQEEDLTSIYSNGQHLLNLINEVLDMAKIEAGKMTLAFEPTDLIETARGALATVTALVNEEEVKLLWDGSAELPIIEADPVRVRQILINLLSNAAKYTEQGHIRLQLSCPDKEHVHIAVEDTGVGIAAEDFDKLFVAFEQIDNSTTRTVGGTGLGLPITKWLVNSHHGRIWFESKLGQGSTFHVLLPVKQEGKPLDQFPLSQTTMSLRGQLGN